MNWETPSFVDVNMSAEIGSYQDDLDGGGGEPLVISSDAGQPAELTSGGQPG